jgi:hypothetical protein
MSETDSTKTLTNDDTVTGAGPGVHANSGWLRAARLAWYVAAGLALVIFVVSIPGYLRGFEQQTFTATAAIEPAIVNTILNFSGMIASMLAAAASLSLAALGFCGGCLC